MKPSNRDNNLASHQEVLLYGTAQMTTSVNTHGCTKYLTKCYTEMK